jgi:chromosome condensin MukBEF MukE localization factor
MKGETRHEGREGVDSIPATEHSITRHRRWKDRLLCHWESLVCKLCCHLLLPEDRVALDGILRRLTLLSSEPCLLRTLSRLMLTTSCLSQHMLLHRRRNGITAHGAARRLPSIWSARWVNP